MLQLILLLFIIPSFLGLFIQYALQINDSYPFGFFFVLGFLVMIAEFALICYPAIYFDTSFHLVCLLTSWIYGIECLLILIWLFLKTRFDIRKRFNKRRLSTIIHSPFFWAMLILCGFQIIRLIIAEPYQMRDSKTYNALIVDILQSDHLFRTQEATGFPLESVLDMKLKFSLSPWYPFISMLAKLSRLHPLIISNTILPGYILLTSYIIVNTLGYCLFNKNPARACQFTSLCAFIQEITLYCHTPTTISLVWPTWGKGCLSMTVVPAILVLFIIYTTQSSQSKNFWSCAILFLVVITGCSMSTMAAVALPMEIGILGLIRSAKQHSPRPLVYSMISISPAMLYLIVYYYLSLLQNMR